MVVKECPFCGEELNIQHEVKKIDSGWKLLSKTHVVKGLQDDGTPLVFCIRENKGNVELDASERVHVEIERARRGT